MPNVYERPDDPDPRQDGAINSSRFRPRYRKLDDAELALHDQIKAKAAELEELFEQVPYGRYRLLGMTSLEEAVMWTIKELTS